MEYPEKYSHVTRDLTTTEREEFEKNRKITLQITFAPPFSVNEIIRLYDREDGSTLSGRVILCEPHNEGGQKVELEWVAD
jgi:hypothetical protein